MEHVEPVSASVLNFPYPYPIPIPISIPSRSRWSMTKCQLQSFRLRQNAEGLGFHRNAEFDGKLIIAQKGGTPVGIGNGLKLTIVGPMLAKIQSLHKKHQQWLDDLKHLQRLTFRIAVLTVG